MLTAVLAKAPQVVLVMVLMEVIRDPHGKIVMKTEHGQIVIPVTPAPPMQSLEMTMDGLLKVIRRFSDPTNVLTYDDFKACFEVKCE